MYDDGPSGTRLGHRPADAGEVLDAFDTAVAQLAGLPTAGVSEVVVAERLVRLTAGIARLEAAHADTARAFDAAQGWAAEGHRGMVSWLRSHTVWSEEEARVRHRAANDLCHTPGVAAALAAGRLSFRSAELLTRTARIDRAAWADVEDEFVDFARGASLRELRAFLELWRDQVRPARDPADEKGKWDGRSCHLADDPEGRLHGAFVADPTDAGVIRAALHHYEQILHLSESSPDSQRTPAQRRLDALVLLMRDVLTNLVGAPHGDPIADAHGDGDGDGDGESTDGAAHGDGNGDGHGAGHDHDHDDHAQSRRRRRARRRRRPLRTPDVTITIPVDLTSLVEEVRVAMFGSLPLAITGDLARYLTCGLGVSPLLCDAGGQPLAMGRTCRTATAAQRRALIVRDGGCAFPDCGMPANFCDAHHIRHWDFGGPTDVANLVLTCGFHHRLLHKSRWKVWIDPDDGRPRFRKVPPAEPAPHGADPEGRCCRRMGTAEPCDHDVLEASTRHRRRRQMATTLVGQARAGP